MKNNGPAYVKSIGKFAIWGDDKQSVVINSYSSEHKLVNIPINYFVRDIITEEKLEKIWINNNWNILKQIQVLR